MPDDPEPFRPTVLHPLPSTGRVATNKHRCVFRAQLSVAGLEPFGCATRYICL
jgi:hypothetical protein